MKFSESTDSHLIDDLKKENDNLRRQLEDLKSRYTLLRKEHSAHRNLRPHEESNKKVLENEQRLQAIFDHAAIGIVELRESEEMFSTMFQAMPIGISLIALSNGIIYDVNQAWLDMTGFSRKEEVIGKNSRDLGLIPVENQFDNVIREFQLRGKVRNAETTFVSKKGNNHVVSLNLDMIQIKGEKYVFYTISDITEIKQSERRIQELLRISQQRAAELNAVIESMPDAVYIGTENGITVCNSKGLAMLGANSLEDLHDHIGELGKKFNIRWPDTNIPLSEEEIQFNRALKGETVIQEIMGTNAQTGEDIYIRSANAPIIVNGQIIGAVAINSEITDQKRIEQEIKQKNEELTRFIYTISHDLKSPLVTIQAFTAYLSEDITSGDKEAQQRDINYVQNAADKMGKLLDELLELSRIGRKEKAKSEIALKTVAESALDLVAGRIDKNRIKVIFTGPEVILYGHSQRFIQLYQNLIDNAAKFMGDQPEPLIEIGSFRDKEKNNAIILFVRDNGSGIDPRYSHKIFSLFEKLDNSTEGTGIGLALVRRIIEVHGGSVWFVSEGVGKGTTFYFTLEGTRIINKK